MVPDIFYSIIVVWVLGLIDFSLSFNADKSEPFESNVGAEWKGLIYSCVNGSNRLSVIWDMRLWPVSF